MNPLFRNSYLREAETVITASSLRAGRPAILCRDVLFFASGGGQPDDHGVAEIGGAVFAVAALTKEKGDVWIELDAPSALVADGALDRGKSIVCRLDWQRRYRAMRMHTLQHCLAAAVRHQFGGRYETYGMTLTPDLAFGTMHFTLEGASWLPEHQATAQEHVRQVVDDSKSVYAEYHTSLEAAGEAYPGIFRFDPKLQFKGKIRIVVISGVDANPCGGTHINKTSEIGAFSIIDSAFDAATEHYGLRFTVD
jgi:Ser-tRNA(Ala) deacylase AlaX